MKNYSPPSITDYGDLTDVTKAAATGNWLGDILVFLFKKKLQAYEDNDLSG
jgi:hypothetical protein